MLSEVNPESWITAAWVIVSVSVFCLGCIYGYFWKRLDEKAAERRKKLIHDSVEEYIKQKEGKT